MGMPSATALTSLMTGVTSLVLAVCGVTDPAIPVAVQATIPPAAALVVAAAAWFHHKTKANADAAVIAAAQVAAQVSQAAEALKVSQTQAAQALPSQVGTVPLAVAATPSLLAQIGQGLEAVRSGVVAAAPATSRASTAVLAAVPDAAGRLTPPVIPADDYPTETIPVIPALPAK